MSRLRRLLCRLHAFLRPGLAERRLAREVDSHIELLQDELVRRGLARDEALRAAHRALGGVDRLKEHQRDARSFIWLEDARRDVRYALRTLARAPVFTCAAVVTLAIGIGGSTAVFSVISAVLLRPLPFRDPDALVLIRENNAAAGFPQDDVAPAHYAAFAAESDVLESLAAIAHDSATLTGGSEPEKVEARRVTQSFFPVLGVAPMLGRVFTPEEDRSGGPRVAILSHRLWQRRFGSDPTVIGRDVLLNNELHTVVGVMPRQFQFLESYVGVWLPAAFTSEQLVAHARYLTVVARVKPGVGPGRVQASLDASSARLARLYPGEDARIAAFAVPLFEYVAGDARRPLLLLLFAVGSVLLIACANLGSLLLARAAVRRQEMALRGALGAARGRLARQLLTEGLVLSAMGLALGLVLAQWSLTFLEQLVPPHMSSFARVAIDERALGVTTLVSLVAGISFGLAPALQVRHLDLVAVFRGGGNSAGGAQKGRRVLVVAEVAMTLVLLAAAGLLVETLYRLRYADLGLRPEGVLTLRTALPPDRYPSHAHRTAFYDDVLRRVTAQPGVLSAGFTTSVPLEWKGGTTAFAIEGKSPDPAITYDANHRQVSADYFSTMGIPLERGRLFSSSDVAGAQPVAIVNQTMAQQYWPGEDAIGKRVRIEGRFPRSSWLTIVGIVRDVRQMGLAAPVKAEMYVPYAQFGGQPWFAPRDLVVRTNGDPMRFVASIKHEIHAVDPAQPVSNIRTLDAVLDEDVATRRIGTKLLLAFASFALLLSVVGVYGVISYFVAQHVPEIGIRLALGARPRDVVVLVAGEGLKLALVGIAVGTIVAVAALRLMSGLLYGVSSSDPTMIVLAALLLVVLAFVASYVPARQATRLDPWLALRSV